jgi:hypothetical protein
LQVYSQAGLLLYEEQVNPSGANPSANTVFRGSFDPALTKINYAYLGGKLIGKKANAGNLKQTYSHYDALGSVTLETNIAATPTERTYYQPYGQPTSPKSGPGYTGHVMDPDVGLVYMQGVLASPKL